jgi:hypothetical protein
MISSLLSGKRRLNEDWPDKFCSVLGVTLGDFEKLTAAPLEPKVLGE